jgi:exosortase
MRGSVSPKDELNIEMTRNDKIKLAILLSLWALLFAPVYPELVRDWLGHSDNSHGFLVPVIAGYLAWQRKDDLRSAALGSSPMGGALLICSLLIYILSYAGGLAFPARVALVLSLLGLVWYTTGNELTRRLAFPILFLLFMIPVPDSILGTVSLPLQLLATKISANLIEACSIPLYREGNMLYFMNTQLEVAEACSGIRSIMSLSMLAVVFASMFKAGWIKRVIIVISAIPIAMVANILRITGTGILANFFGDRVARGFLHEFSGLAIFAFGFVVLLGIFSIMNRGNSTDVK